MSAAKAFPPLDFATVCRLIEVAARAGAELALLRPSPAGLAKAEAAMPAIVAEQVRAFTLQHTGSQP